jgi:hypothetical protein
VTNGFVPYLTTTLKVEKSLLDGVRFLASAFISSVSFVFQLFQE